MRIRIDPKEIEHYARAKRDRSVVRAYGQQWRVLGVTSDLVPDANRQGTLSAPQGQQQQQWWVELIEA